VICPFKEKLKKIKKDKMHVFTKKINGINLLHKGRVFKLAA